MALVGKIGRRVWVTSIGMIAASAWLAVAQSTTAPTTQESTYDRLLGPDTAADVPLKPTVRGGIDQTTGNAAVSPNAPALPTKREGSYITNQTGRLSRVQDGSGWDFVFNADGEALQDPPMRILPNLKLMVMEDQLNTGNRDLQFRVSGMVTEYRGRNYLLLEKVVVVQDAR
jgi:hypothetical protein